MPSISRFRTNEQKEREGVWVDAGAGLMLKLGRLPNPRYRTYIATTSAPLRHQIRNGTVSGDELKKIEDRAIAKHVLVGWENLQEEDENGNEVDVPYSEDKAFEFLSGIKDFRDMVTSLAQDPMLFKDQEESQRENEELGKPSSGTPSGEPG